MLVKTTPYVSGKLSLTKNEANQGDKFELYFEVGDLFSADRLYHQEGGRNNPRTMEENENMENIPPFEFLDDNNMIIC